MIKYNCCLCRKNEEAISEFAGTTQKSFKGDIDIMETSNKNEITNLVKVRGRLVRSFGYSHTYCKKNYYKAVIEVERFFGMGDESDYIPVIAEEAVISQIEEIGTQKLQVEGALIKYSPKMQEKKPFVYLYAKDISIASEEKRYHSNVQVKLKGRVCSKPFYKQTYSGKHLVNFLLEVERPGAPFNRDYIPCILWGRLARFARICLEEGDEVTVERGWIQSRKYKKRIAGELVTKEVIEVVIESFS